MAVSEPMKSLKRRISSLFSWISFQSEKEDYLFHPETVIFEKINDTRRAFGHERRLLPFLAVLLFFIFAAGMYAATIKGVPGNPSAQEMKEMEKSSYPFELSPERGRYAHTYALAELGSFSLTKQLADVVYPDVGYVDGRFYSFFAPGISILAVPFYILGSYFNLAQVFTFGVISLFALGNLFFLYRIGKDIFRLQTANALLAPIIFAFGSTSWSYATTLYQHHLTTFFTLSAFYAVWKFAHKSRFSFFWAAYVWFAYAAAFMVDYPNMLFMFPVMVYFGLSAVSVQHIRRSLDISVRASFLITSVVFFIFSFLHGYYNYTQLGGWTKLSGNIVGYKLIREHQLLEKSGGKETIAKIKDAKSTASFFSEENLASGLNELLIAPDKGILFFSPIFILAIAAIISALKNVSKERAVLLSLAGLNLFLYASFGDPWGGWAFGPRYLTLSMGVLSLFIALWIAKVRYQIVTKVALFILFAFSLAVSLLGVLTTNSVPPKVEADYLHIKYGFFANIDYFKNNVSSSYVYNTFFSSFMTLGQYFLLIYASILILFTIILFMTRKEKVTHED